MAKLKTRRALLLIGLLIVSAIAIPSPVAASQTQAGRIISIAASRLGDRYSFAATGPTRFDCSGFVYWVYKQAGLLSKIGGARRTVAGYHQWFASHGTVTHSLSSAKPGDVLIWGVDHHAGIYVGNGYAISALINPWGVTKHPVIGWINLRLSDVLQVNITR
jgi:cell wall-associated NlpC family hydrolase